MIGMAAALFGDEIDRQAAIDREGLLYAVQRAMFSPSGALLDVRSAVLITITSTEDEPRTLAMTVVTGAEFDTMGGIEHTRSVAAKYSATFEVTDGRHYTASGSLRKAERVKHEADLEESKRVAAEAGMQAQTDPLF